MPQRRDRQVRANCPRPAEPLVGREQALADLTLSLQTQTRLVTLTGPVGVGKSRLAWAVAEHLLQAGTFETAVVCDLEGIDSADACHDALTRAAGLTGRRSGTIGKALDALGQMLLVLDGFDSLVELASSTLTAWLDAAPSMTCLVTSRRLLGMSGESLHELGPLQTPAGDATTGEAAAFFLQCAGKIRAGYVPTPAEAPFLAELIRELDGLPLALQLAAPRLAVMGPAVLLHRVRTSRSVLRARKPVDGSIHRSFDAAMESSWQSLSAVERDVLCQLTVFSGGMTAEAVEAVVSVTDGTPVVDMLQSLRERSMLHADVVPDGTVRLRILRGVRNYVTRHGDPARRREARQRHAAYFAQEADRRASVARTAVGSDCRAWLAGERGNLLCVVRNVAGRGHVTARAAEPALRVLLALDPLRGADASTHEFASLLETALDATRDSGADPLLFGRAMALRGAMRRTQGRIPAAMRDLMQSLHVAETVDSAQLQGASLLEIGRLLVERGEVQEARNHFQKAMDAFRSAGARSDEAYAWQALAELEVRQDRLETALPLLERAIALFARLGEPQAEAGARCALARAHVDLGAGETAAQQISAVRALPLADDDGARLEADLLEAVSQHDLALPASSEDAYLLIESAARRRGATSIEAEALAFQALARAQARAFGEAHALFRAAFDTGLRGDATLWSAIANALDARVAPEASTVPPPAATSDDEGPQSEAVRVFRGVASSPSRWTELRQQLLALSSRHVIVRLGIRALDQAAGARSRQPIPADTLVIGRAGRWFRMPGEEVVSLERRRPLALLLDRLAKAREEDLEAALAWDVLQEAGWPGERILATAGAHRVRVAISTMRKLGLRDALETTPDGYKLAATRAVSRVDEEAEGLAG